MDATDPETGRVQARARGALVERDQFLSFFEGPKDWSECANIQRKRGHRNKVRQDPADFAMKNTNDPGPFWNCELEEFLCRKAESVS